MGFRLKPQVQKIINVLKKYGFYVVRIKGDHIIVNKYPPLRRPNVISNVKRISNAVWLNLLKECGVGEEEFSGIF